MTRFFYSDDAYHLVQGDGQACDDNIRRVLKTVLGLTLRGPGLVSPNRADFLAYRLLPTERGVVWVRDRSALVTRFCKPDVFVLPHGDKELMELTLSSLISMAVNAMSDPAFREGILDTVSALLDNSPDLRLTSEDFISSLAIDVSSKPNVVPIYGV